MNAIATVVSIGMFTAVTVGCAKAQQPAAPQATAPGTAQPLSAPVASAAAAPAQSIDATLDRLDQVGKSLKDFTADVTLNEVDNTSGAETARNGKVYYDGGKEGNARIRVTFLTRDEGTRRFDDKIEYVLQNGVLVDRNYSNKSEVRRQVLQPGEKANLLKLGEGPFPLPIGQDKAEVHRLFDVTLVPPADGDPADTVHLRLSPKLGTQFATKFTAIDVWMDNATNFPVRIDAEDANQTSVRQTHFKNVQTNKGLRNADFTLEPVEGWNLRTEEFAE